MYAVAQVRRNAARTVRNTPSRKMRRKSVEVGSRWPGCRETGQWTGEVFVVNAVGRKRNPEPRSKDPEAMPELPRAGCQVHSSSVQVCCRKKQNGRGEEVAIVRNRRRFRPAAASDNGDDLPRSRSIRSQSSRKNPSVSRFFGFLRSSASTAKAPAGIRLLRLKRSRQGAGTEPNFRRLSITGNQPEATAIIHRDPVF